MWHNSAKNMKRVTEKLEILQDAATSTMAPGANRSIMAAKIKRALRASD